MEAVGCSILVTSDGGVRYNSRLKMRAVSCCSFVTSEEGVP